MRKQRRPRRHLGLWGWYTHKRKIRVDAQIRDILNLRRATKTNDTPRGHAALPPAWSHKTQVLTGDTVYLGHNNSVRSFILSTLDRAEPEKGKVSIASPIGRTLTGRHQGDTVRLATLDGDLDYTILKII